MVSINQILTSCSRTPWGGGVRQTIKVKPDPTPGCLCISIAYLLRVQWGASPRLENGGEKNFRSVCSVAPHPPPCPRVIHAEPRGATLQGRSGVAGKGQEVAILAVASPNDQGGGGTTPNQQLLWETHQQPSPPRPGQLTHCAPHPRQALTATFYFGAPVSPGRPWSVNN